MTGEGLLSSALATKKPLTHQTLLEYLRCPLPARALGHAHAFQLESRNKDLAKPAPLAQIERVRSQYEGFLATSVSSTLEMCARPSARAGRGHNNGRRAF